MVVPGTEAKRTQAPGSGLRSEVIQTIVKFMQVHFPLPRSVGG